jgi:ankyrin repeat protein
MHRFDDAWTWELQQLRVAVTVDNVNAVNNDGWKVLHFVAEGGSVDCVKCCIEMGANVNASSRGGATPLHSASLYGNVVIVRVLLDAGAIVDANHFARFTPLKCAIFGNYGDVACLLMDRGAKVSNVKLDEDVPAIPDWVTTFIESRSRCRSAAIVMIAIHKYHRTNVTGNNDINVIKLISKHVWSMRMDDAWKNT